MTQKQVVFGLGGVGLSLALWSAAAGQQGDGATPAPDAPQAERTVELVEIEEVEVEDLANEHGFVLVQEETEVQRLEDEAMRQVFKQLVQEGVITQEEAREMLGQQPGVTHDQPDVEANGEVTQTLEDGGALYLPLGTTQTLTVEQGATLEMPFVADGPGILTVAYSAAGRVRLEVTDARGRQIETQSARSGGRQTAGVGHGLVPLGRGGEYTVRLTVGGEGEIKLGAEWIPFPTMETVRAEVIPEPDPDTELTLVPDRMVVGSINTADPDTQYLWCRYDAEQDGQLVVLANASQGDITMQSFEPGRFRNALEYRDDDLNGSVANEGMILDVRAGETYYVRVDMRSGQRCDVEVRTGLIPLPEDE